MKFRQAAAKSCSKLLQAYTIKTNCEHSVTRKWNALFRVAVRLSCEFN